MPPVLFFRHLALGKTLRFFLSASCLGQDAPVLSFGILPRSFLWASRRSLLSLRFA